MSLNSVNTNVGAMIALQSLNRTNEALAVTQKRISTGFRVADAKDDGAVFAVAQAVRSDVGALTSANEQLGGTKGLLETTMSALRNISDTMKEMRNVLVKLADANVVDSQREQYIAQYNALRANIKAFIDDAGYNGKSLLAGFDNNSQYTSQISVVRNQLGQVYSITGTDASAAIYNAIATPNATSASDFVAMLSAGSSFMTAFNQVGSLLNQYGNDFRFVSNQIRFNKDKIDALESGLGALIDADMAKEAARLQSLQIRQQLGAQSLGIANQAPQILLSLFR